MAPNRAMMDDEPMRDTGVSRSLGMAHLDWRPEHHFFGILHVDDVLLCSALWCSRRLERLLQQAFPGDFRWEVEEDVLPIKFLHAEIFSAGWDVWAVPHLPNGSFAAGLSPYPKRFRCPYYIDDRYTPLRMLRSFLLPHLHGFGYLVGDMPPVR